MTHLRIIQSTGATEEVSSSVILKLYELSTSGDLDDTSVLLGRVNASVVKDIHFDYFMPQSGLKPYQDFYVTATNIAISFADPEVERVLISNNIGSNGMITLALANAVGSFSNNMFKDDTSIISFNELPKFTNVHTIPSSCFSGCSNLESIDFSNITEIGLTAFLNCTSLTTLDLSNVTTLDSYSAFSGCSGLTSVILSSSLTLLGSNNTFDNCTNLSSIDLSHLTSIADSSFYNCPALTSINLASAVSVGSAAFRNCTGLTLVTMPLVTQLGSRAFCDCSSLTNIDLSNVISIGSECFSSVPLTSADLSSVTSIGERAFQNCRSLTSVTTPNSGTLSVGNYAFTSCTGLTSIDLSTAASIGNYAFSECTNLSNITLSSGISLSNGMFSGCSSLSRIDGLVSGTPIQPTSIGDYVFNNCSILPVLTYIGFSNCTSIGASAFKGCLISGVLNLPECTSLGQNAFLNCVGITEVHAPKLFTLNASFDGVNNLVVFDAPKLGGVSPNFSNKTSLTTLVLDFDNITEIPNWGWHNCTSLTGTFDFAKLLRVGALAFFNGHYNIVIRRTEAVCEFTGWGNQFGTFSGIIYVPDSLLSDYRSHAEWSKIPNPTNLIKGISELPSS